LEHARIMYFRHGGDAQLFISSADWMPRNLDRRVELLVPVVDRRSKKSLESILKTYFTDNQKSWALGPDGVYTRTVKSGRKRKRSQQELYERARRRVKEAEAAPRTMFEPHRPAGR
jgi:polyphosphate kinase